jgi:hypothetical protein
MIEYFSQPKLIGVIADVNTGKSNFLYHIIKTLKKTMEFSLYSYGLKFPQGKEIFSLEELEQIENSVIVIDECFSLFDLENRGKRKMIENTFRLLHHNNNIIILSILPENGKKFLAAKINTFFFKKLNFSDCINGSLIKRIAMNYCGNEKGNTVLNIPLNKVLVFDSGSYNMIEIQYHKEFDSKLSLPKILKKKK